MKEQPRLDFVTPDEFKRRAKEKKLGDDCKTIVVKSFDAVIKEINTEERTIDFIISTDDVDRQDDVISIDGWNLDSYKKNPVVLWAHQNKQLPIAKSIDIAIDGNALRSTAKFVSRDVYSFADTVFQLYQQGFLNAVSVGFNPIEWEWAENEEERPLGIDFLQQELLEYSAVPIPANPNALIDAKAKGVDVGPLLDWAEQCIEELADICGKSVIHKRELQGLQKIATLVNSPGSKKFVALADYQHLQRKLQLANIRAR